MWRIIHKRVSLAIFTSFPYCNSLLLLVVSNNFLLGCVIEYFRFIVVIVIVFLDMNLVKLNLILCTVIFLGQSLGMLFCERGKVVYFVTPLHLITSALNNSIILSISRTQCIGVLIATGIYVHVLCKNVMFKSCTACTLYSTCIVSMYSVYMVCTL